MKRTNGYTTRQLKRKTGVKPADIYSLYAEMKTHISDAAIQEIETEFLHYQTQTVGDITKNLKEKLGLLEEEMKKWKPNGAVRTPSKTAPKTNASPKLKVSIQAK